MLRRRTKSQTVKQTSKYSIFSMADRNRTVCLDSTKRRRLVESMQQYGFIPAYPIYVYRRDGRMEVQDGQHRLAAARQLGLPVYYIEVSHGIDIPRIQNTQAPWTIRDYAESYANTGNPHYRHLLDFAEIHDIPLSTARAILSNRVGGRAGDMSSKFQRGEWKITSQENADRVVYLLSAVTSVAPQCRSRFLIAALFAYSLIEGVDDRQLTVNLHRKPELARQYGSRDGYLDMLEQIYNFGSRQAVPIRICAENMLKNRNRRKAG